MTAGQPALPNQLYRFFSAQMCHKCRNGICPQRSDRTLYRQKIRLCRKADRIISRHADTDAPDLAQFLEQHRSYLAANKHLCHFIAD